MNDQDLLRFSRHILLDEIGIEGQEKINRSHVLMIGAGGLGSACAPYLVAAGIGELTLVDHDTVDLTNLQRQIMHTSESVGMLKVESGAKALHALNPSVKINTIPQRADEELLTTLVNAVDVIVDCTDNFKTRHAINRVCARARKPLVFGAAIQFDGQVSVFDTSNTESPCYACLFSEDQEFEEVRCSTMGVFSPLVGIIGTIQAAQALQVITKSGNPLMGRLLLWDGRSSEANYIRLNKKTNCSVCG